MQTRLKYELSDTLLMSHAVLKILIKIQRPELITISNN
jgi:hypothetical protein